MWLLAIAVVLLGSTVDGPRQSQPHLQQPQQEVCTASMSDMSTLAAAEALSLKNLPGLLTCERPVGKGAGVVLTAHVLDGGGSVVVADLLLLRTAQGAAGAEERHPQQAFVQPARGCRTNSSCPWALVFHLPAAAMDPINMLTAQLRVFAKSLADTTTSLPLALSASVQVSPLPWSDSRPGFDVQSMPLPPPISMPLPFTTFHSSAAVLYQPLQRHLVVGATYNFELSLAFATEVVLVPWLEEAQPGVAPTDIPDARWTHLTSIEHNATTSFGWGGKPELRIAGGVKKPKWRGSHKVCEGRLLLMARFSDNGEAGAEADDGGGSSSRSGSGGDISGAGRPAGQFQALLEFTGVALQQNNSANADLTEPTGGVERRWRFPNAVHVEAQAVATLGLRPVSHPYAEIEMHSGPYLRLLLETTAPAWLSIELLAHNRTIRTEAETARDNESSCDALAAVERLSPPLRPRVSVDRDSSGLNHTILVHFNTHWRASSHHHGQQHNNDDAATGSASSSDQRRFFTLRIFAIAAVSATGDTQDSAGGGGWPLAMQYSVSPALPATSDAAPAYSSRDDGDVTTYGMQLLGGMASSAVGGVFGQQATSTSHRLSGGGFGLQLRRERSGTDVAAVDSHAKTLPDNTTTTASVDALARALCVWREPLYNYRAIYVWVTTHITYDQALLEELERDPTGWHRRSSTGVAPVLASTVLAERKAVCSGFAELTAALCLRCEIAAVAVHGHARSHTRLIGTSSEQLLGHAWVALALSATATTATAAVDENSDAADTVVNEQTRWTLSDPTWGGSDIDDEATAQHSSAEGQHTTSTNATKTVLVATGASATVVDEYYYMPSAAELLATHLPRESFWQLISTKLTIAGHAEAAEVALDREAWDNLPKVKPAFWKSGLLPMPVPILARDGGERVWELCTAVGRDGFYSWTAPSTWAASFRRFATAAAAGTTGGGQQHCTELHGAGLRPFGIGQTSSGEWEVLRFGLKPGARKDVDLLASIWPIGDTAAAGVEGGSDAAMLEGHTSVMRHEDTFSVYVVLPRPGLYGLRLYAAFGGGRQGSQHEEDEASATQISSESDDGRHRLFMQALDFLLDASPQALQNAGTAASGVEWVDCPSCMYPKLFGPAGDVTIHAPRQRRLAVGHHYNVVLELSRAIRSTELVVRNSNSSTESVDVALRCTTVGALLGLPRGKLLTPVHAGSFRCEHAGSVITIYSRRHLHDTKLWAAIQFECTIDGALPSALASVGSWVTAGDKMARGVPPPRNMASEACERLSCLPTILPNAPVVQPQALSRLALAVRSSEHVDSVWIQLAVGAESRLRLTTRVAASFSVQLHAIGLPAAAAGVEGIWTFVETVPPLVGDSAIVADRDFVVVPEQQQAWAHTIRVRCPRRWRFKLSVFAAPKAPSRSSPTATEEQEQEADVSRMLPLAVEFLLDCTSATSTQPTNPQMTKDAIEFPKPFLDYTALGATLLQPHTRHLKLQSALVAGSGGAAVQPQSSLEEAHTNDGHALAINVLDPRVQAMAIIETTAAGNTHWTHLQHVTVSRTDGASAAADADGTQGAVTITGKTADIKESESGHDGDGEWRGILRPSGVGSTLHVAAQLRATAAADDDGGGNSDTSSSSRSSRAFRYLLEYNS